MRRFIMDKAFVIDVSVPVIVLAILIWIKPDVGNETIGSAIDLIMFAGMALASGYQVVNCESIFSPCQKYASTLFSVGDEVSFLWHPPGRSPESASQREGRIVSVDGSSEAFQYKLAGKQPWQRRTVDIESKGLICTVPLAYVRLK